MKVIITQNAEDNLENNLVERIFFRGYYLKVKNIELWIVGDGPELKNLKKMMR